MKNGSWNSYFTGVSKINYLIILFSLILIAWPLNVRELFL